jgi:UDP-glucuronate 4-epimerase
MSRKRQDIIRLDRRAIMPQRVTVVTGGAGFLGSHIAEVLLRRRECVILIDVLNEETNSKEEKGSTVEYLEGVAQSVPGSRMAFYEGDILDEPRMTDILQSEKPAVVIHAASLVTDRRSVFVPEDFIQVNVLGTQRVWSAISKVITVEHVAYISSRSAIGETAAPDDSMSENDLPRPINPYGATKVAGEALCHSYHYTTGIPVSVCRLEPMYGPRCRPDMLPRRLLEAIHTGNTMDKYGSGEAIRDWLFVTDAVRGILAMTEHSTGFEVFGFGTGIGTTVNELIALAEKVTGKRVSIVQKETPPGDAVFAGVCDYSKAKRVLGWEPIVSLEEGLKETFKSLVEQYGR